jgi:hypothetical protein
MKLLQRIMDFFSKPIAMDQQRVFNVSSGDPVGAFKDNEDLMDGLEFIATLQFRTPLRVLMLNGKKHIDSSIPPPNFDVEPWQGTWVPKLKSWRELGLDIDEPAESASASEIGLIHRGPYLPFLMAIRKQVESEGSISLRIEKLHAELRKPEWTDFVARHQGIDAITNKFFPFFIDTLPAISTAIKEQLKEQGIKTADQLSQIELRVLLSVKGIGKVKAAALKEYATGIKNRFDERIEAF